MSRKKNKRQIQNNNFPWVVVVLGGILLAIAAFIFASQGGNGGGKPSIVVDQQKIDYGDVKFNVEKTFTIKVTNSGNGTLRFKEEPFLEVLKGC